MMTIKSRYRICKLEAVYNDVEMTLQEIIETPLPPIPEKEESQINLKTLIEPLPKNDDERLVDNYMKAIQKMAPVVYATMKGLEKPASLKVMSTVGPAPKRLTQVEMFLSLEEYRDLGSPSLNDTIEVTLKKAVK